MCVCVYVGMVSNTFVRACVFLCDRYLSVLMISVFFSSCPTLCRSRVVIIPYFCYLIGSLLQNFFLISKTQLKLIQVFLVHGIMKNGHFFISQEAHNTRFPPVQCVCELCCVSECRCVGHLVKITCRKQRAIGHF